MRTKLTPSQSHRLIELGVDPKLASDFEEIDVTDPNDPNQFLELEYYRIFTLTDILSLLPKELCERINGIRHDCHLSMYGYNKTWGAMYRLDSGDDFLVVFESPELIDALFELLVWCITNKHLKV